MSAHNAGTDPGFKHRALWQKDYAKGKTAEVKEFTGIPRGTPRESAAVNGPYHKYIAYTFSQPIDAAAEKIGVVEAKIACQDMGSRCGGVVCDPGETKCTLREAGGSLEWNKEGMVSFKKGKPIWITEHAAGTGCSLSTRVERTTKAAAMEDNGWIFSDFDGQDKLGGERQCSQGSFNQYAGHDAVSTARKDLQLGTCTGRAGQATIDFGNCWDAGKVNVYLNGVKIASAPPNTPSQKHTFSFQHNDMLELKDEEGNAIIQIKELTLATWDEGTGYEQ